MQIVRKDIKNLHLGVYPPNGRVRVAAPHSVSDTAVRLAVIGKLGWIRRQRANFAQQPRQSKREFVSGESHWVLGNRYRLRIVEVDGLRRPSVRLRKRVIELTIRTGASRRERERVLDRWRRGVLREAAAPFFVEWQPKLGVAAAGLQIRRMKTKWGSCSEQTRRVSLNVDLVRAPVSSIEYVVVHELAHLRSRRHDRVFETVMDAALPNWTARRAELRRLMLPAI